jgi:hypothetical protein
MTRGVAAPYHGNGKLKSLSRTSQRRSLLLLIFCIDATPIPRAWEGNWYFIPKGFKDKYFELCMLLMQRPEPPGRDTLQREITKTVRKAIIPQNLHPFF